MKQFLTHHYSKKKVRGLKRRLRTFLKYVTEQTESLPNPKNNNPSYPGYSNLQVSFYDFFPDSIKTPNAIRKFFIQTIIDRIHYLVSLRTNSQHEYRIFCALSLPNLEGALIGILYTKNGLESFYDGLFSQNPEGHSCITIMPDQDVKKQWGIHVPNGLDVKGYKRDSLNEFDNYEELWLIGILD